MTVSDEVAIDEAVAEVRVEAETPSGVRAALAAAAEVVGADRVAGPFGDGPEPAARPVAPNTSYRPREVYGVIRPTTAEQTRQVVEIFGRDPEAGSLHPYSTGRNWGLGGPEPARDRVVVLDLTGLDRVRELDVPRGWAVIEPGVTQGALSARLTGTERMINVTASSSSTSVLGNALDRGVGLRHQRPDDLVGLEVALPDGRLLRVGWWPDPQRRTPVYPLGMGPSPLHLFTQSDLGVVTAGVVRLLPRPEALRVVRLNFPPESLVSAVDLIRRWVAQGLVNGVVKVFNPVAARGYGATGDEHADHHLAHIPVDGTAAAVAALTTVVTDEATASGLFSAVSADDDHEVARLVERSYLGDPDREDTVFRMKIGQPADLLDSNVGFLFFLPLVPFTGADIGRADSLLARVREETGVRCGATLNVLGPDLVDYVVSIRFQRDEAESERAHRALDLLYPLFHDAGFVPYRLDVDHTDWLDRLSPDQPTREFVRELKDTLDPHRGIAPGRYS